MGSVYEEITRLETAKADIETAIEGCGVNVPDTKLISDYALYIRQIPSAVFSDLDVGPFGGEDMYIKTVELKDGLITAATGGLVSSTSSGLVPKVINTNTATIGSAYYVLASANGSASPSWYKLPTNVFKNDNTTYTFTSGTAGNFTVTPSGGTAQTVSIGKPSTAGYADTAGSVAWANVTGKPTIPTVTNYYWADIKISNQSNTSTSPTFAHPTSIYSKFTNGSEIIGYIGRGGGDDNLYFGSYKNANINIFTDNNLSNSIYLKTGGNVGIGTSSPAYKLDVVGSAGFGTSSGCDVFLRRSGGYSYINAISSLALTVNNNSGNIAVGIATDKHATFYGSQTLYGLTSTCNKANDAEYMSSALQIREYNFGGSQLDTWAIAPRLSWHWSGRVQTQIGLSSSGDLKLSKDNFTTSYLLLHAGNSSVSGGGSSGGSSITVNIGGTSKTLTIPTSLPANGGNAATLGGYDLSSFMTFGNNGGSYINASFNNSDLSQLATDKYIEFWDGPGWFNSQWGKVTAHYGFVGNLTGTASYATSAGSATKATQDSDGNTINATYLKLSGGTMTGTIITPGNDTVVIKPKYNNYDQIGGEGQAFWKIWATNFYGSLHGNAASATYATSAGISDYLKIHDIRGNNYAPNSTNWPLFNIKAWFNNTGTPNGEWWSGITVKGWDNTYNVWLLASTSTSHSYASYGLFFRTGNGSNWTNWKNVVTSESVNNIVVTSSLPATKVNNTIYILV